MKRLVVLLSFLYLLGTASIYAEDYRSGVVWEQPKIVQPGNQVGAAPSDAIVLFDGKNMDAWTGGPWEVKDNVLTVNPGKGQIVTKQKFGSCQLHLEFMTPPPVGKGQGRGNSGLFFMNHYEVQILDSFNSPTYYDGQCASIYKESPPYVNVCRKPGEWQTYDVIFTKPILQIENNKVTEVIRPAYITVIHNGVVVQNHFAITGSTFYDRETAYEVHTDREPISLQDHGNRMKFRNIWIREIPDSNNKIRPKVMPFIFKPDKSGSDITTTNNPEFNKYFVPEKPQK